MAKSRFKKSIGKIHLWLGLSSGLLVFLISISGSIYVFRDELFNWIHYESRHVEPQSISTVSITDLWQNTQKVVGKEIEIHDLHTFTDPSRSWEFHARKTNDSAVTYFDWIVYDYIIYVNPYSGELIEVLDHKYEFFHLIKMLHWSLLLHTDYGQDIVGWSVVIFVLMLISGLILWWPKKRKDRKKSFLIKWRSRWRRINYDLHRVMGFYVFILALIISITGLAWAFKPVQALIYVTANGGTAPPSRMIVFSDTTGKPIHNPLDLVYTQCLRQFPEAPEIELMKAEDKNTSTIGTYIRFNDMVYYDAALQKYDKNTGELLASKTFDDLTTGEKAIYMNYDIHVGAVFGIFGKIIAFIASLICASLPITGFLVWWGRKKKK